MNGSTAQFARVLESVMAIHTPVRTLESPLWADCALCGQHPNRCDCDPSASMAAGLRKMEKAR
jgi:hypothetical protein